MTHLIEVDGRTVRASLYDEWCAQQELAAQAPQRVEALQKWAKSQTLDVEIRPLGLSHEALINGRQVAIASGPGHVEVV
ncbi:MAG: hypothetical protein AAF449_07480 [Myxococcota bacterium]